MSRNRFWHGCNCYLGALQCDVTPELKIAGRQYVNVGGSQIERYGMSDTVVENSRSTMGCRFNVAEAARAMQSVSTMTGPLDKQKPDVLFSAGMCVVVFPGIVDKMLQTVKPKRCGNL